MTFAFTPSDDVRHTLADGVLTVTIDRPEKRNPLSLGVLDSLRRLFADHAENPQVRLAVLTGAGDRAFASGGDLAELAGYRSPQDAEAFSRHGKAALDAIRRFPVPVIARINGVALGGGCELALACDQRLAVATARLGMIHGRLAIAPSWGGGNDLVRLVGPSRALALMLDAEPLAADAALQAGLLDAICPADEPFDAWFAGRIGGWARHPRQVLQAFKALSAGPLDADRARLDAMETAHFARVWAHEDHWEAVARLSRKA